MTKLGLFLFAGTMTLASVVACSSSDAAATNTSSSSSSSGDHGTSGTSGTTSSSGSTSTGTGSAWAQALCAHDDKCNPAFNLEAFGSTANCVAAHDKGIAAAKAAPDTGATDAALATCAAALQAAGCTAPADTIDACVFKGKRAAGAGCAIDEQCTTGVCIFGTSSDCGTCGTGGAAGDDCSKAPCATGLECDFDTNKCVVKAVTGGAKGAACTPATDTSDDSCGENLECVSGTCATVTVTAQNGQPCGKGVECVNGGCSPTTGKCIGNLAEGAACNDESSDEGPFCGGELACIDEKCQYEPTVATCN